jgi:hypothetical protein
VRDQLLRKKEKLLDQLKALAATIPTTLISATTVRFTDLERQLKAKAGSIEDVDAQRRWVALSRARQQQAACGGGGSATTWQACMLQGRARGWPLGGASAAHPSPLTPRQQPWRVPSSGHGS